MREKRRVAQQILHGEDDGVAQFLGSRDSRALPW